MPVNDLSSIKISNPADTLKEGEACYLRLSDGSLHPMPAPEEFHVKGTWELGRFVPGTTVDGGGQLAQGGGTPGWMELRGGQFHGAMTARPPISPYVNGIRTDSGFVPTSRDVR